MTHNPPTIPPAPDLATVAAAYRQAADLISTSYELRDYTDDHMDDINQAAVFLRRCADELHRADAAQPSEAPRNALSAPHTAEPPAPGHGGHPGGENGPHTGTQDRAELCRQFKAAITRRWDVAPFVIDEIVDDAVDCHLELAGRDAGAPPPADEERRQRWEDTYRRYDAYDYPNLATIGMSVADAEQAELRARLEERTRQLGEVRTRTTELEARVNGELAAAVQRVHELESAAREADRLRRDWATMRDRAEEADAALARGLALCDDADRRGITSGPPLTADRIRAALTPQAGDDTTGATP